MDKDKVRQLFPQACELADELRAVFGDGVKLVHLQEGERELGKPGERGISPSELRGDAFVARQKSKADDKEG